MEKAWNLKVKTSEVSIEARITELEKRVTVLEGQLRRIVLPASENAQPQTARFNAEAVSEAPLVLEGWDYRYGVGELSQHYYAITLRLRNPQMKPIKLIDAGVAFTDLLDQVLYRIRLSPDILIAPGKTHTSHGNYPVNQLSQEQMRMKDMNQADIKATSEVRRIVFSDNTIWQAT